MADAEAIERQGRVWPDAPSTVGRLVREGGLSMQDLIWLKTFQDLEASEKMGERLRRILSGL